MESTDEAKRVGDILHLTLAVASLAKLLTNLFLWADFPNRFRLLISVELHSPSIRLRNPSLTAGNCCSLLTGGSLNFDWNPVSLHIETSAGG
mmetsp:Transcript_41161/g.88875  ORF Transcript_41161/g.88875 Transcript_41161/m.88875 type:complete len:92 (-) Transcript_41161:63-338(-)